VIAGTVTADQEAVIPLPLLDNSGQEHSVDAVVDTGFTGALTLPAALIAMLGLPFRCRQQVMLADGSLIIADVFVGQVSWDGQPRVAEVEAAETEPLVGMTLLHGSELSVQVIDGGSVTIQALP
jgi:clan AA aspartic protease